MKKTFILFFLLIMIFICSIVMAQPLMQKAEIKQINPQKTQKGKELKVLDEKELKAKKIDVRTLPDSQRIRIEGKIMTVGELKARAANQERKMKTEANRLAKQAEAKFRAYKGRFEQEQARRQNNLRARARVELETLIKTPLKPGVPLKRQKPVIKPKPKEGEPEEELVGGQNPVITRLSVSHGQPGDPVLISGQDFGDRKAQVAVFVASGDVRWALIDYWSPTQILASVPNVAGIPRSYNGGLYVKTARGRQSNLISFRFDPAMEIVAFMPWYHNKYRICYADRFSKNWSSTAITVRHSYTSLYWGCSKDDEFHHDSHLPNGSIVTNIDFTKAVSEPGEADARVSVSHVGTNNPYVKVHWWSTAFDWVTYTLAVYYKRPKEIDRGEGPTIRPKGN